MIYLLTRINEDTGYDEYDAKIVRAGSEGEARMIANERTGDEGQIWQNGTLVKCEIVTPDGKPRVLLESFNAG